MNKEQELVDFSDSEQILKLTNSQRLMNSHSAGWKDIYLEFHSASSLQVDNYVSPQHQITMSTLKKPKKIIQIYNNRHQAIITKPNFVSIIPAFSGHHWAESKEYVEGVHLVLEPKLIGRVAHEIVNPDLVELIPKSLIHDPLIYQILLNLKKQLEISKVQSKLYAESAATFLSVHLLHNYTVSIIKHSNFNQGLNNLKLKQAREYIHDNLDHKISLDELAQLMSLSRYYLIRMFKKSLGMTPYQYITQCRINKAKQLLKETQLDLIEIAIKCGFCDQSHFHNQLKKWTGVTPKQFRKSVQ